MSKTAAEKLNTESSETINNRNLLITLMGGILGSLLIGLVFWGLSVFSFGNPRFLGISFGIIGSLAFAALKYRTLKDSILFTLFLLLLNVLVYKASPLSFVVRDIVLVACLWLAIFFYWLWIKRVQDRYLFLRALGLAAITAVMLMVSGLILVIINVPISRITSNMVLPMMNFYFQGGVITGLGMGLGFDAAEMINSKL